MGYLIARSILFAASFVSVVKFAYFYRTELFNNIQRGVLKLPVSMSLEAKNLIVHLLNRNPSRRLGAGPEGADEIKRHQFFADIDWNEVAQRRLIVPKPKASVQQYKDQYHSFSCTDEQKRKIFEDFEEF